MKNQMDPSSEFFNADAAMAGAAGNPMMNAQMMRQMAQIASQA